MGKSTISMAIFNSYVSLPEGKWNECQVAESLRINQVVSMRVQNTMRVTASIQVQKNTVKYCKYLYGPNRPKMFPVT